MDKIGDSGSPDNGSIPFGGTRSRYLTGFGDFTDTGGKGLLPGGDSDV